MATRRKPTKVPPVVVRAVRTHRKGIAWTISTLGGVIAILAALWPFLPKFQTVEAAELHAREDAKVHAEALYGQARIEAFVLRGQVNECESRTRSLKQTERQLCDGYRREYEQADRRMQTLYKETVRGQK